MKIEKIRDPDLKCPIILKARAKIKTTPTVELRSSNFWVIWKAETILLNLSTTFMGVWTRYPATPSVRTQNVGWSCIGPFFDDIAVVFFDQVIERHILGTRIFNLFLKPYYK